ncbi:MAG: hypothetical protein ACRDK3_03340 [Actinomycetota bacterium]
MVETITPVVHGGRSKKYWTAVALHALGATLSAAVFGFLLGGLGALLRAPWGRIGAVALMVIALMYAVREGFGLQIPLPDRHAQVPQWWRDFFSAPVSSFLYGAGLGIGFFTFLQFGTYVAVAAGALLSGSPLVGALLCIPFGLTRGLSVILTARARAPEDAGGLVDLLDRWGATPWPRLLNALMLAGIAVAALLAL